MAILQQELLLLKGQFENLDTNDALNQTERLIITTNLEELRQEFRELLIKLQKRQCELSGMIPSDEEDEMDPNVRVRLRSESIASKVSLKSNEQRLRSSRLHRIRNFLQSSTLLLFRIFQLDKDDASEYNNNNNNNNIVQDAMYNSASSLKMSFCGQKTVKFIHNCFDSLYFIHMS